MAKGTGPRWKDLRPPMTTCPNCGRGVRRVWGQNERMMFVDPTSRRNGPLVVTSAAKGRRVVMRRQRDLFGEIPTEWGYDAHDCRESERQEKYET